MKKNIIFIGIFLIFSSFLVSALNITIISPVYNSDYYGDVPIKIVTDVPSECRWDLYDENLINSSGDFGINIGIRIWFEDGTSSSVPYWFLYSPKYSQLNNDFSTDDNLSFADNILNLTNGIYNIFFISCYEIGNLSNEVGKYMPSFNVLEPLRFGKEPSGGNLRVRLKNEAGEEGELIDFEEQEEIDLNETIQNETNLDLNETIENETNLDLNEIIENIDLKKGKRIAINLTSESFSNETIETDEEASESFSEIVTDEEEEEIEEDKTENKTLQIFSVILGIILILIVIYLKIKKKKTK